jgi:anti-sigma B factor antagonist
MSTETPSIEIVTWEGELDIATVPGLRTSLSDAAERGARRLVVDLTKVTFIDSMGIGAILNMKKRLGPDSRLAVVLAPNSYVRVIFDVVGADSVVEVFETREEAAAHAAA